MKVLDLFIGGHYLASEDLGPEGGDGWKHRVYHCTSYLMGAVIELMRPSWIQNSEKHKDCFTEVVNSFNAYRKQAGKDDELIELAKKGGGLYTNVSASLPSDHMLCVCNLGLSLSEDPRDKRFVHKTLRTYFRKAFPEYKRIVKLFRETVFVKSQGIPSAVKAVPYDFSNSSNAGVQDLDRFLQRMEAEDSVTINTQEALARISLVESMGIMVIMLLGRIPDFDYCNQESPVGAFHIPIPLRVSKTKKQEVLSYMCDLFNPSIEACEICSEEVAVAMVSKHLQHAIEDLMDREGDENEEKAPGSQNLLESEFWKTTGCQKMAQIITPIIRNYTITEAELNSTVNSALREAADAKALAAELAGQSMEAESERQNSKELIALKTAAADMDRKLRKTQAENERIQRELLQIQQERAELSRRLSEANTRYDSLNKQMIELLENSGVLMDDEEFTDESQETISGLRNRIGEDAYQKLKDMRVMIVGGHVNTCAAIRELFPDWEYRCGDTPSVKGSAWAVDAIACITTYISHRVFIAARDKARAKGIQFIPIPHNGPAAICQYLNTHIAVDPDKKETA